jgi:His-Xaa-Ser system protein HxsD
MISLLKEQYPEWVVRNSLYWISNKSEWLLGETANGWEVTLKNEATSVQQEFQRLLNDFTLRHEVGAKTDAIRGAIADNVLNSLNAKLRT